MHRGTSGIETHRSISAAADCLSCTTHSVHSALEPSCGSGSSPKTSAHAARAYCLCVLRTRWIAFDDGSLATIGIVCSAGLRYRDARELASGVGCSLARAAAWLF